MPDERPSALPAQGALLSIRDNLEAFISEPRADIDAMTIEEIDAFLKDEGVDLSLHQTKMQKRFAQIAGEERRQRAAAQRQDFLSNIAEIPQRLQRSAEEARQELRNRLDNLQLRNPQSAGVFFRNLDGADDDDVEQMLADLDLLEEVNHSEFNPKDE